MDLEERFSIALHATAREWRRAIDRRLRFLGVSQASWLTIAVAARTATPPSQSQLADQLGVEGATMVAMIDRLVKAGLVTREASALDRRVKRVVVSESGRRLYDRIKTEAAAVRTELLAGIDRAQLESATALLETLERMIADGA